MLWWSNWRYNLLILFALLTVITYLVAKNEQLNAINNITRAQYLNNTRPIVNNVYNIYNTNITNINTNTNINTTIIHYNNTIINNTTITQSFSYYSSGTQVYGPCGQPTMVSCLFNEHKNDCVWCPSTLECMNKTNDEDALTKSCPHWCEGKISRSNEGLDYGVGTFNQVQEYIDHFLLARAFHVIYVPYSVFITRFNTGVTGKRLPAEHAFDYEYMSKHLEKYMCILPSMPDINATYLRHGGKKCSVSNVRTYSTNVRDLKARQQQLRDCDFAEYHNWMFQYIIDNQEDNDMVMQYWKYFKTNKTMEDVASQVMREIDMTDNKFLAVHLRVEADWAKPPYSRGFPHPDELVKELKKHRDTGDVYLAVGEPITSDSVSPYVTALKAASYTVKVKPAIGKYFPDCAECFDLASLVDFNILLRAYVTYGVQLSTFYQGVYNTRRMRDQKAILLTRVPDAEIWSGYIPSEWDQSFVNLRRDQKMAMP